MNFSSVVIHEWIFDLSEWDVTRQLDLWVKDGGWKVWYKPLKYILRQICPHYMERWHGWVSRSPLYHHQLLLMHMQTWREKKIFPQSHLILVSGLSSVLPDAHWCLSRHREKTRVRECMTQARHYTRQRDEWIERCSRSPRSTAGLISPSIFSLCRLVPWGLGLTSVLFLSISWSGRVIVSNALFTHVAST